MDVEITFKNYRCFSDSNPATFLMKDGFTALIGVNNSGKSTILKFFYEFRKLFKFLSEPSYDHLGLMLGGFGRNADQFINPYDEVFCNTNDRDLEIKISFKNNNSKFENPILEAVSIILTRHSKRLLLKLYTSKGDLHLDKEELNPPKSYSFFDGKILNYDGSVLLKEKKPVVDMKEAFDVFKILTDTLYVGAFRNVINARSSEGYYDVRVGLDFVHDWRVFKTGQDKKQNEEIYSVTDSLKHIFGFNSLEINASASDDTLQLFINGKSYKLHEIGSGISQFIFVLANACIKKPSYILIDEPELNLHPSLQLDFLTSLGAYASKGTIFATHSMGLARASSDRIYSVNKYEDEASEITEFESTPRLPELLGELSFSGYRELGFDKILLVEGPTEVKTLQQFLRWDKKDHKIVILPLGGKSLINGNAAQQLEEIKRISENVYALIDSEKTSLEEELQPRIKEFVEICKKCKITCRVLERRAIENYFTENAIRRVKGANYGALKKYQKLSDAPLSWSKSDNWRIAREMNPKDLEDTDLGEFLKLL